MITTGFAPYEFSEAIVNSKLVLALKNQGHQIDVISRESQQVYSSESSNIWEPLKDSIYFIPTQNTNKLIKFIETAFSFFFFKHPIVGIRWGYKVYRLALKLNEEKQYDILLTRMPSNVPHLIGKKLSKKLDIPWIANWNDPTDNIRPMLNDNNYFKSFFVNLFVKDIIKNATLNTFPSPELWQHFNQKIIHNDRINVEIIPHIGIELKFNSRTHELKNEEFTMCHAGNMLLNVNSKPFLQALIKLKEIDKIKFKFNVYGIINEKFKEMIKSFKLEDNVICYKSLLYELMIKELQKQDLLVLLEAQYEKGILLLSKLSDYASLKKPILCISPKEGVIPDYIEKYGGGISVNNRDTESIYQGLKTLINEWEKNWPQNKISSFQNLYKQFSPETIVKKYEQCFDRISVK